MDGLFFTVYRTASWDTGFSFWGAAHLGWLAGFAVFLAVLLPLYRRAGERARRRILLILTLLLAADELAKHGVLLYLGEDGVDYLPLHLCSVGLFLCLRYAARPGVWAGELLYAVSLPGALIALLFPGWSVLPPFGFLSIHSFTFHMLLAAIPLCLLASGELRPRAGRLWFCALFLLATAVPIWVIDRRWGTNFYFLTYPGVGNPLVWFEARFGNPGYQIGLPVCAGILWLIQYSLLAGWRALRRRRNGDKTE